MLYVDDIQHCSAKFLQKFISLADGQRKMDGIFEGESKTYDLRGMSTLKSRFVSIASHESRTPLSVVLFKYGFVGKILELRH